MLLGDLEYPDDNEIESCEQSSAKDWCPACGRLVGWLTRKRDGVLLRAGHSPPVGGEGKYPTVPHWCILSRQEAHVTVDDAIGMERRRRQWHIDQIIKEFEEIVCR